MSANICALAAGQSEVFIPPRPGSRFADDDVPIDIDVDPSGASGGHRARAAFAL
jgi:hypothetical protein